MDLKDLQPTERVYEMLHPGTKQPLGVRVTLLHVDDDRLKVLRRKIQDERYRQEQRGKAFKTEQYENNVNEICYTAITAWEWYNPTGDAGKKGHKPEAQAKFNGEIPQLNKKNVMDVFEKLPWFRRQIFEEIGDDEAFFGG